MWWKECKWVMHNTVLIDCSKHTSSRAFKTQTVIEFCQDFFFQCERFMYYVRQQWESSSHCLYWEQYHYETKCHLYTVTADLSAGDEKFFQKQNSPSLWAVRLLLSSLSFIQLRVWFACSFFCLYIFCEIRANEGMYLFM